MSNTMMRCSKAFRGMPCTGSTILIMVKPDDCIIMRFDVMQPCRVKLCTALFDHHDITMFLRNYEQHDIKKTMY
jgi:hypothetical protein